MGCDRLLGSALVGRQPSGMPERNAQVHQVRGPVVRARSPEPDHQSLITATSPPLDWGLPLLSTTNPSPWIHGVAPSKSRRAPSGTTAARRGRRPHRVDAMHGHAEERRRVHVVDLHRDRRSPGPSGARNHWPLPSRTSGRSRTSSRCATTTTSWPGWGWIERSITSRSPSSAPWLRRP